MPNRFLWFEIFLPAIVAITAIQDRLTVKTILFLSFFKM